MSGSQQIFNLLTQQELEETIEKARAKIRKLRKQGKEAEVVRLKRELREFEKLWKEMIEFGDYRVDSAGVVWKKEK